MTSTSFIFVAIIIDEENPIDNFLTRKSIASIDHSLLLLLFDIRFLMNVIFNENFFIYVYRSIRSTINCLVYVWGCEKIAVRF